jgi:hypothetical protein
MSGNQSHAYLAALVAKRHHRFIADAQHAHQLALLDRGPGGARCHASLAGRPRQRAAWSIPVGVVANLARAPATGAARRSMKGEARGNRPTHALE